MAHRNVRLPPQATEDLKYHNLAFQDPNRTMIIPKGQPRDEKSEMRPMQEVVDLEVDIKVSPEL